MDNMAPGQGSKVLAAAAHGFEHFVLRAGADPDGILGAVGLTPDDLCEPTRAIALANYCQMLENASDRSGNPHFGLQYGAQFQPEMLGLIGFIALASPTFGAALRNFTSLFHFHQNGTETRMMRDQGLLRMEYRVIDSRITRRRHDAEFTIAAFLNVLRRALGEDWAPVRVEFEHAFPGHLARYHQAFDADVLFRKPTNALVFREEQIDRPMQGSNLQLLDLLCASLTAVACSGEADKADLIDLARKEVRARMPNGAVSLQHVAEALRVPVWTLQRRLRDKGMTFTELVEDVRRKLAIHHIKHSDASLTDIALLLGYSEVSAFSRAFRQWYGVAPRSLRARN